MADPGSPALWQRRPGGPVGREHLVSRAAQLLRQGASVVVSGPRWSGRSDVLDAVSRTLESEGRAIRVVPARWRWADLDAGAPRAGSEDLAGRLAVAELRDLMETLDPGVDTVVVDDVDELGPEVAALVRTVLRRSGVPALVSHRLSPRSAVAVLEPRPAGPVVEIPLPALTFEELHTALEQRIGEPVSPALSAHLHRESAGRPGLAIALLVGAIAHDRVTVTNGVWSGDDIWSPDMHGFFRPTLAVLTDAERDAADLLARLGAVPASLAERLVDPGVLDALERRGLADVVEGTGDHHVLLRPPALSTHLLHQRAGIHLLRQVRRALATLDGVPPTSSLQIGVTQARAKLETYVRPGVASPASGGATGTPGVLATDPGIEQTLRHEFAIALGAWQDSHDVGDALRLLRLCTADGRDDALVQSVFALTDPATAEDGAQHVDLQVKAARWAIARGAELDHALAPLTDPGREVPHRDSLMLLGRLLRYEFGALDPAYESVITPFLGSRDPVDAATARFVLAAGHCFAGRYHDALRLIEAATQPWPEVVGESALLVAGLCWFGLGQPQVVIEEASALYTSSAHRASAFGCLVGRYTAALGLSAASRLDEARDQLILALPLRGGWAGLLSPERAVRGMLIYLSVVTYREQFTPGLVELVGTSRGGGHALPWGSDELLACLRAFSDEGAHTAAARAAEIDATLRGRGLELAADVAALLRELLGTDAHVAGDVPARVRAIGGEFLAAMVEAQAARARRDGPALMRLGYTFRQLSRPEHAIGCFAAALDHFRVAGQLESAKQALDDIERTRTLVPHESPVGRLGAGLTPREQEVASLAAAGRSNPEIAAELHLSLRTVETHVRSIRRKTGVTDRSEFPSPT